MQVHAPKRGRPSKKMISLMRMKSVPVMNGKVEIEERDQEREIRIPGIQNLFNIADQWKRETR